MTKAKILTFAVIALAFAAIPAHAGTKGDPLEPVNRAIFSFNDVLDRFIIKPIAKGYKAVVPSPVRDAVRNFTRNIESPLDIANALLQGKVGDAGVATARLLMNTTVGLGGLVDVADKEGLKYKEEDFGQTLAVWGVGNGPYLVLPVIGPSSLRDTTGLVVDSIAHPVRIVAHNTDNEWIYYTQQGVKGLDLRSRMIKVFDDLRNNNLDYYAAMRSAYLQHRDALVKDYGDDDGFSSYSATDNMDHP